MKVSIITTCFNRERTIAQAVESVLAQDYPDIEYIVVDGASTDGSLQVIRQYDGQIGRVLSEPDHGMYEAINKGIRMATGEVIGLLHSDDFLFDSHVISDMAECFQRTGADLVYGNGLFVDAAHTERVVRNWMSGPYRRWKVRCGWLPLHPTVYLRREGIYEPLHCPDADGRFVYRQCAQETDVARGCGYLSGTWLSRRMAETDENGVEGTAVFLIQSDGLHEFSVSLHNSQSCQENALDCMLDVVGTSFSQEYADAVEAFPASPVWSTDSSYSQCLCHSPYLYALAFGDERPCLSGLRSGLLQCGPCGGWCERYRIATHVSVYGFA